MARLPVAPLHKFLGKLSPALPKLTLTYVTEAAAGVCLCDIRVKSF
jgi:hypothetical protein